MKVIRFALEITMLIQLVACKRSYVVSEYQDLEEAKTVNFCNLDESQNGDLVSMAATYSGVEEYWGLRVLTGCDLNQQVYLNTDELVEKKRNAGLSRKLQRLQRNYDRYSLHLLIIGVYETSSAESAFGHLGLQKKQIKSKKIQVLGREPHKLEN